MAEFEFTIPVLIAGGGACGCVAALAAQDAGVGVLLVERDARPLGSTAMSQGLICAAGTAAQAEHSVDDDAARFYADILAKTRGQTDPAIARMIAEGAGPTLDWMMQHHGLPWSLDTGFRPAYGHSTYRVHGWRGHGGEDMIGLLHQRLSECAVDVMTDAQLTEIMADPDGRVRGVTITRPGGEERVGCLALILATGGFAANHSMVSQHMPEAASAYINAHEGSDGAAVSLGTALGAATGDMGSYQGYAMLTDPQGISVPPGVLVEGGVLVNRAGRRFVDESADIAGMVHPVMAQPEGAAWVIFDARIEAACAYIPETIALIELNAARTADDITTLAQAIGVEAGGLEHSINAAWMAQQTGRPDAFGRDWGDDLPPAAPYRALKVRGALYHTQGGLQTDGETRVLRRDGSRLPNLFAGGGAARGVSGPSSWGYLPAMGLCAAVTTGRIAGQAAARLVGTTAGDSAAKLR